VTRVALALAAAVAASAAVSQGGGTITTVVGPATVPGIVHPRGLAVEPGGGFVFADAFGQTVRRVRPDGRVVIVAGIGTAGFGGDGGPATNAELDQPHGVAFTRGGVLLVADALNNRIRAIAPDETITTVAGTGARGFSGDGGPATAAKLSAPRGVSATPGGGYLIPDTDNDRVRLVRPDGTIVTVAGPGAGLDRPFAAVAVAGGAILIADTGNDRIRRVSAKGTITTVAGNGVRGFGGDGGPATAASLNGPHNLAALPDGGFLIADEGNNRVRRVWPSGTITTVAGTGTAGFSGDGGAATAAELDQPKALAVLPDLRGYLVADAANSRIRVVSIDLREPVGLRLTTRSLRARAGTPAALVIVLSDATTVRVDVLSGKRVVVQLTARRAAGPHTLRFGQSLHAGRYTVAVRASAPRMRPAAATASLVVTRVPR
jgi:hypothetical protein